MASSYAGDLSLDIYNSAGEHIKTLISQSEPGSYSQGVLWDGTNKYGDPCASGVYLIIYREPFAVKTKRVLLVR